MPRTVGGPAYHYAPPGSVSYGREVAELCDLAGASLAEEQQIVVDDVFAAGPDGLSAADAAVMVHPHWDEVTGALAACALGWLYLGSVRMTVVWSAAEPASVRGSVDRIEAMISSSPLLKAEVEKITRANGAEAVMLRGGRRLVFTERRHGHRAARGIPADKVIFDDAHRLGPPHLAALFPALSIARDPQVVYGAAFPPEAPVGEVLAGLMEQGRAGTVPRLAYAEWTDRE